MRVLLRAQPPGVATARVVSLVSGFLYALGGVAAVLAGLAGPGGVVVPALLALGAVAVVAGALVLRWGTLLPRGAYHGVVASGTCLIAVASALTPDPTTAVAVWTLSTFVALDSFFYFAWPGAVLQLLGVMVACAVVLGRRPEVPTGAWVLVDAAGLGIAVVVGALVRRASTAARDPLTELANRRGFEESLEDLLRATARTAEPLAAALIDVDHFKSVNDVEGHQAGDQLLRALARRWRELVPPGVVLARHGGDEFALLLPRHSAEQALVVAERLRDGVEVGVSCGVTAHRPGESGAQLMRRADRALYQAKAAGRGRCVLDEHDAPDELVRDLDEALRLAEPTAGRAAPHDDVDAPGLHVVYQSVVDLDDARVVGVEALVRWTHPRLGAVPAAQVVRVAEQHDLVGRLGALVMERAFADLVALRARTGRTLLLTLNVSGLQLCDPAFPTRVLDRLERSGWDPARTVLEVTESLLDADSAASVAALRRLRACGLSVAVDDFGTGYSSLSRLDTLPTDFLKLDHSFVSTVTTSPRRARLLRSVVRLAGALELDVIAEGVETEEQRAALVASGCRLGQGYHFHRPGPLGPLEAALRAEPLPTATGVPGPEAVQLAPSGPAPPLGRRPPRRPPTPSPPTGSCRRWMV